MSTLNVSIVALVAVVIAAVMLFNFWQSRANRREAERMFRRQTGILEERAGAARKRQQSFERDMDPDPAAAQWGGALYADDAPDADDGAVASARREPRILSDDPPPGRVEPATVRSVAGPAPASSSTAASPAAATAATAARGAAAPARAAAPEAAANPILATFADDLRRITERMPRTAGQADGPTGLADPPPAAGPLPASPARVAASPMPGAASPQDPGLRRTAASSGPVAAPQPAIVPAPDPTAAAPTDAGRWADESRSTDGPAGAGPVDPTDAADELDPQTRILPPRDAGLLDVDLTVDLTPATPVNSERLIALTSPLRHAGTKPIRVEVDRGDGRFEPLQSGSMARRLRCMVLLANRQGPINAVELSDFFASLTTLAQQTGARLDTPDMNEVLARARDIDTLAADLDTQVEVTVEAGGAISPAQLATIGRKLDLFDRGSGRHVCLSESGEVLYTMSGTTAPDLIRFMLDVPRVGQAGDPWRALVRCASGCAQLVGGRLVDAQGRGMSLGMIEAVGRQLERRFQQLEAAGLRAGSPVALRVFN